MVSVFACLRPFSSVIFVQKGKTIMGLTIHYGMTSKTRSADRAKALVEQDAAACPRSAFREGR